MLQYIVVNLPEQPHLRLENVQELSEVKGGLVDPNHRFDPTHIGIYLTDYAPEFPLESVLAERFGVDKDSDDCWRTTYTIGSTVTSMLSIYEKHLPGKASLLLARLALHVAEEDPDLDTIEVAYTIPVAPCNTRRGRAVQNTYTYSLRKSHHKDGSEQRKLSRVNRGGRKAKLVETHEYFNSEPISRDPNQVGAKDTAFRNAALKGRLGTV